MEDEVPYGTSSSLKTGGSVILSHDSWSLTIFRKQRRLSISSLDYHAGPLIITGDDLVNIARKMGLHVRTRNRKKRDG